MPPSSSSSHHYPLKIQPKELVFAAPFNRVITSTLDLINKGQYPVLYKVKTTAPQRYCVRPNNGLIAPGATAEVQVLLNVKDAPPSLDVRDKFQIQSIVLVGAFSASDIPSADVWDKATQDQIMKQKLKSKFIAETTAGTHSHSEHHDTHHSSLSASKNLEAHSTTPSIHSSQSSQSSQSSLHSSQLSPSITISQLQSSSPSVQSLSTQPLPSAGHSSTGLVRSPSPVQPPSPVKSASSSVQLPVPHAPLSPAQLPPNVKPTSLPSTPVHHTPVNHDRKVLDGLDHSQYLTPPISSINPLDSKSKSLTSLPPSIDLTKDGHHEMPKKTGDHVVDTVANFSQLRKTLEQVANLKGERENLVKDNHRLNEHVKTLVEQLHRAKDEHQARLRQRTTPVDSNTAVPPPQLISTKTDTQQQQMLIQIQTRVFLLVILFFAVFGFMLGRLSR